MASITTAAIKKSISAILKDADLNSLSAKKVRKMLETEYKKDLTERKAEIDELVMSMIKESQKGSEESSEEQSEEEEPKKKRQKTANNRKPKSDEDESEDEEASKPSKKKKKEGGGGGEKKKRESTYTRKCALSEELAAVMGTPEMARPEVVKKMWAVVRERNLLDPKNKQYAICDEQLHKVFGTKRVRMFGMMKYLKNHITDIK